MLAAAAAIGVAAPRSRLRLGDLRTGHGDHDGDRAASGASITDAVGLRVTVARDGIVAFGPRLVDVTRAFPARVRRHARSLSRLIRSTDAIADGRRSGDRTLARAAHAAARRPGGRGAPARPPRGRPPARDERGPPRPRERRHSAAR